MSLDPEWTFESEIYAPLGVRVSVTVSVPVAVAGKDVVELSEYTQMAATRIVSQLTNAARSQHSNAFRGAEGEVPF